MGFHDFFKRLFSEAKITAQDMNSSNLNYSDLWDDIPKVEEKNNRFEKSETNKTESYQLEDNSNEQKHQEEEKEEEEKEEENIYRAEMGIPKELRTPIQQYLIFFRDFAEITKGVEIEFTVSKSPNGLNVESKIPDGYSKNELNNWFEEYVNYFKKSINKKEPPPINVEKRGISENEVDLLTLDLKNQVAHLKNSIEIFRLKNKNLIETNEFLKTLTLSQKPNINIVKSHIYTNSPKDFEKQISLKSDSQDINKLSLIQKLISAGRIQEAIDHLIEMTNNKHEIDELVLLKSKFSKYKKDDLMGLISFEESQLSYSKIVAYLLSMSNNKIK